MSKPARLLISIILGLSLLSGGCLLPSAEDVSHVLSKVRPGVSRSDLGRLLVEAYGKKHPRWKSTYDLSEPPQEVTKFLLSTYSNSVISQTISRHYVQVYPSDLLEKMPDHAFFESLGIVSIGLDGANAMVTVFFDSKLNYLGFIAFSSGKAGATQ